MRNTTFEGDHHTLTFGAMHLFDTTQPGGPKGPSKFSRKGPIPGLLNKRWEFAGSA